MLQRVLALFVLLAPISGPCFAQALETGAFSLPTLDATARGAALGGSPAVAIGPDAGSFLYNPALLSEADDGQVGFGYLNHLSSLRVGSLTYARSGGRIGMIAAGVRFLGWGGVPRTDEIGATNGEFRAGELGLSVTGSRADGDKLRYGATIHVLRSAIDGQSTSAVAADAGVVMHWADKQFAVSASVHRLGVVFGSIGSVDDSLPADLRLGLSKRLRHLPVLLSVTAYGLADFDNDRQVSGAVDRAFRHLLVGAEFQFSDAFQIRFGYDHRRHSALKTKTRLDVAGLSLGTGIRIRRISVDYAWTSWSSLGGLHRFSIATSL
jgi:hypothetical protein